MLLPALAGCVSTVDGPEQGRLPDVDEAPAALACGGRTAAANWRAESPDRVYVDVDARHCGASQPLYFTALEGQGSHWRTRGTTSIHHASADGFRVYVQHPQAAKQASESGWRLSWLAEREGVESSSLCTGRTTPDGWRSYEDGGVVVKADLSACGFSDRPVVITSLEGERGHTVTRGASSVYSVTRKGFRVFVQQRGVGRERAAELGWRISWLAVPEGETAAGYCAGRTRPGESDWQPYGKGGVTLRVPTTGCQQPLVFSSLGGRVSHWYTKGGSSINAADERGFRVRVARGNVSPRFAAESRWHVNWLRIAAR